MRIAYFLTEFPAISQPFVLYQIVGAMEHGHEIKVLVPVFSSTAKPHPLISRYGLFDNAVCYRAYPQNFLARMVYALKCVVNSGLWKLPLVLLEALNFIKYGREALSLRLLIACCQLIEVRDYDVIHCQFANLGPFILRLKKIGVLPKRLLVSVRGFDVTKYIADKPGYYNDLIAEADLFLPVSQSLKQRLIELGCDETKIEVIHSGMDVANFPYVEHHFDKTDSLKLLSVGRLVEKKGFEYAIRAIALLIKQGMDIQYVIVGDGDKKHELAQLVSELKLAQVVKLLGACSQVEIKNYYAQSDIFLAPSVTAVDGDQEGIPNVVKEAMASGLPVISTYHSGIPELVEHEVSGLLVPERDVGALSKAIVSLASDQTKAQVMACAARRKVEIAFDNESINARLDEIYQHSVA